MRKLIIILITLLTINPIMTINAAEDEASEPPSLSSNAAIMIDAKTGSVLYEKNADTPMYPASLTKIATAIYAIETGDLDDIVTVSEKARNVEGTRVFLEPGEQVPLKKLIQGLIINSGNDAGVAIAEHLSGSVDQFAEDINKYLKEEVGVKNTHFENPHGLFDPNHMTTAEDLAKITRYAIKNELFREIFGTVRLEWHGETWDTTLLAHQKMLRQIPYEGVTGGKTGFVNQSGFTLATTAKRDNLSLIVITLNADIQTRAYDDTMNLLDYGFENFTRASIPEHTTFQVSDKEFETSEELFFTHKKSDYVTEEIESGGKLHVVGSDGSLIDTFQLKEVKDEKATAVNSDSEAVKTNSFFSDRYLMIAVGGAVLFLILLGIILRRRKKV
ncbi:D-alanyl-D-alanine carboxypeptidase family protein [Virgibacillus kekensis]|uniref:D-alanyl-D-alanine carboxypeptidase family protein n=1 Tax=Virgibacillus kekensis TaxID=202261 RepID=A0ABV9DKQ4_9BACI